MKKFMFLGMSIAIALVFTVSSCGSKEEVKETSVAEEPVLKEEVKKPVALSQESKISVADFKNKATYYTSATKFEKVALQGHKIVFSSKAEKKDFALPRHAKILGSARGPEGSSSSILVTVNVSGKTKWLIFFADPAQAQKYRVWYTPDADLFYWAKNGKPSAIKL
ncbi:MAG: hypothetical protein PHE89_03245 [Alphaproteobacteria bacterium]|nr:hypothetical protein [Alphaproteobacteria bacterium]